MSQYESSVKCIPYSQERVYAKLEDLNNLEALKDKLPKDKIQEFAYDHDQVTIEIAPIGKVTIKIIEREAPKCIKFKAVGSPIPMNLWIQIIPDGSEASKMRIVAKAELNFMLRGMIEKPLKEGLEKIADTLAMIQY
ncbi:MAG: SRPBCC family protein [Bacteroidaceae bacterium]|nr:SRPBCC family protein [Bacteroidaceae bacterium]